jgi:hypothetical protein
MARLLARVRLDMREAASGRLSSDPIRERICLAAATPARSAAQTAQGHPLATRLRRAMTGDLSAPMS